ncbi:DNA-directed RNA polymerase subunit omega [Texcoconibacillus texcoconensis]|nr:DNA-directed RNA polymerase subunit omega [Texcoconibacillus texcoconensis]
MLYPSVDSLMEKIDSKYTLVSISARRARNLQDQGPDTALVDRPKSRKLVGVALEEIDQDKLTYQKNEQ